MAQQQLEDKPTIGFKSIQLLKDQTLGIGSYGAVCKALCDDLLCAAKVIHPTLLNPSIYQHKEHRHRLMQEFDFMSAIKHPNIVQFLSTHQDPQTGLPVLLMELMDDSLTHFLESSQDAVPYHIQVNFCHDITLAISYLHSNGIIHRDLSSNNVLLHGTVQAKVTDFGMKKFFKIINPLDTHVSFTMGPGTDVYMPPEAVKDNTAYTEKIDCFAIGVLMIQILTMRFPNPGRRIIQVRTTDPQFLDGIVKVQVQEIERRQNHIKLVDPNHPLLPIALNCLKDRDVERPSAQELCHRVADLRETSQFTESVRRAQERLELAGNTTEREEELQQQIRDKDAIIQDKDQMIAQKNRQLQQITQELESIHLDSKIGFKSIQLLKDQTLGKGSYGSVCKALCDNLLCAAKVIHPTLIDPNLYQQVERNREYRLPIQRFMQECEFLSAIKHPNIVQFLGTHQDPQTGLLVLLMELMDESLTHFLQNSQKAVPYHIQVNLCDNITLAISYLHNNGITHRDLSSNNVLLRGNMQAKVTDFGMAQLGNINPRATRVSYTLCPGTDVYMPPEAVKDNPVYTAKIDCFSTGVIIIQILTRCFPDPGDREKAKQTDDPNFPDGVAYVHIPEIKRRQNHISLVDPNQPLLPIALDCLKDSDVERPSAQELCHRVAALKETPQFTESVRRAQERLEPAGNTTEREEELRQQVQDRDAIIQEKDQEIAEKERQIQQVTQELQSIK